MMKQLLHVCFVSCVLSIIVTEPPLPTDYKYSYNIEDPTTGDSKSQLEVRQGDVVKGTYSLFGPDGTKRIVEYIADDKNGFKAIIREETTENLDKVQNTAYYNYKQSTPYVQESMKADIEDSIEVQSRQQQPYDPYNKIQRFGYSLEQIPPGLIVKNSENVLFKPANEIQSERLAVQYGKLFEPASK